MSFFAGRTVWIALLLASLLANGVLAGILVQRKVASEVTQPGRDRTDLRGSFNPRAFVAALPEDRQEAARRELRDGLRALRPLMRASFDARRRANEAMGSAEFDADAVLAAMAEFRAARAQVEAQAEQVLLDIVADLDPEARRIALEAAYAPREGRGMRGRDQRRRNGPLPGE